MASDRTIPFLFLNLGGEMMYILDQRLKAQQIPKDKAMKVMNDIVSIMLNERFLKELFKPQEVCNKQALRKLFEDLAHASIMRLNGASMDKLYDLMTMAFKYQVFMAPRPVDLILITMNHLDAIRNFVSSPAIQSQIDAAHEMIVEMYIPLSPGEMQTVRYSILNFFQDLKVRVSVFLRQGVQNNDGKFVIPTSGPVPPGSEVPGPIRLFDGQGECRRITYFHPKGKYMPAPVPGSIDLHGNRRTSLGNNIYATSPSTPNCVQSSPEQGLQKENKETSQNSFQSVSTVLVAQEELNLLMAQLLGNRPALESTSAKDVISINLFPGELEEVEAGSARTFENVINIDARRKPRSEELEKVYGEMSLQDHNSCDSVTDRNDENDLLELLDSLNS